LHGHPRHLSLKGNWHSVPCFGNTRFDEGEGEGEGEEEEEDEDEEEEEEEGEEEGERDTASKRGVRFSSSLSFMSSPYFKRMFKILTPILSSSPDMALCNAGICPKKVSHVL
jgi:hypothetical protein